MKLTHPEHVFQARCGSDSAIALTTRRPPPPESHPHVNVAHVKRAKSAGLRNSVCFSNKDFHDSCSPAKELCVPK